MTSPVIDLSHHNPEPNWSQLKATDVRAIFHKASQGTSYEDPTYHDRWLKATSAGFLWAPYHFLEGTQITKQMDWFLDVSEPPEGGRVVLDHEQDATLDQLCQAVAYLQSKRPDLQITIYSGHTIKEQLGDVGVRRELMGTSLWIAQYTSASAPAWPKQQWPTWSLWQWTDKEKVPGITQPVDGNKWNGTPEALVQFMSPTGSQPAPAPEPEALQVVLDVTIPEGVELHIKVNGEEAYLL